MIKTYFIELLAIFSFILTAGYLLPVGLLLWIVGSKPKDVAERLRIQKRRPRQADVAREIRHSLLSVVLFSVYSFVLFQLYKQEKTAVYWDASDWPLWWLAASFIVAAVLHDTYFYWTHRLMHTRLFFTHFHAAHHKSITPTPWSILAFQPLETILQFGFFALLILFVPMHPLVLLAYFLFDGVINAAGHCGHELVPEGFRRSRWAKYLNAVTHHDLHHSRGTYNFGQYFNIWDRTMATFLNPDKSN